MKSLQSNSKGFHSKDSDAPRDAPADLRWREIRARLKEQKSRILSEMRGYPPPITACDAQFNHLLEQSDAIRAELRSYEELTAGGAEDEEARQALEEFIRSSVFLRKGGEGVSGERTG